MVALLLPVSSARGQAGESFVWQETYDMNRRIDLARDVVFHRGRVHVIGGGKPKRRVPDPDNDFVVRTYDAATGELLWLDEFDLAGASDGASRAAIAAPEILVVGGWASPAGASRRFLVRAYHVATGELLWQDALTPPGFTVDMAAAHGRVLVVGEGDFGEEPDGRDFAVRAYRAADGRLLWQDRLDFRGQRDGADAAAIRGRRAAAVGTLRDEDAGEWMSVIRGYHSRSGEVLWERRVPTQRTRLQGSAVAIDRGKVFVADNILGPDGDNQLLVRAFDADSGAILWSHRIGGGLWIPRAIEVRAGRVVVAGDFRPPSGAISSHGFLRAYDADSGVPLWDFLGVGKPSDASGCGCFLDAKIAGALTVAVGGRLQEDAILRVVRTRDGAPVLENVLSVPEGDGRFAEYAAVAAGRRGRVFAAGSAAFSADNRNVDWVVRAVDIR